MMDLSQPRVRVFDVASGWVWIAGLLAALAFPLSASLAGTQDADGVLAALISTQKLTWYFWGQDRLLNLLPALAWPVHDPEANLRLQIGLRTFMAFLAPLGVIVLLREAPRVALVVTVATQSVLAFCLSGYGQFNLYVQHNPFGTSLVLFTVTVAVVAHWPSARGALLALVLAFLAYATNIALLTFSLPLLCVAFVLSSRPRREVAMLLVIHVVGVLLAWVHARYFGEASTKFDIAPSLGAITAGFSALGHQVNLAALGVVFAGATVSLALSPSRSGFMAWLVAAGSVPATAVLCCLVWVQQGAYDIRYLLTFVLAFVTCCVYLIVMQLDRWMRFRSADSVMSAIVLMALTFFVALGGLSKAPTALIREPWRARANAAANVAVTENVQLIVGEFWDVWPTVLEARERLRKEGLDDKQIYGATFRGHVTKKKIQRLIAGRGEIKALCFYQTVDECVSTTNVFVQLSPAVHADPATVRTVAVDRRSALVYELRAN